MRGKPIHLFMWGYQPHFRLRFESLMNNAMKELGVPESGSECLLVGAKIPGRENPNDVCVEPEDGKWPIDIFEGLLDLIEAEVADHPLQNTYYGDEPSMRDKPENIRRDSVRMAVQKVLNSYDSVHGVRSFAGGPAPVDGYYVVPVLQLPRELFERFRPRPGGRGQLPTRGSHGSGRAPFGHPAPQIMVSLLNGTHCARRAQGGGDRC